jgi:diguanylate cyclase (GGDEF)-like protein
MEAAERELQRCAQEGLPYSLIMIDADYFKRVNDTYGHPVGDVVLKILVARVLNTLKQDTLVARYGGEEFIVSLPEIYHDNVLGTAERIRQNIESDSFKIDDLSISVTISLGVASMSAQTDTLSEIISNADKALYQAKQTGRNKVVYYEYEQEGGAPR